jgi:hypothetical protein
VSYFPSCFYPPDFLHCPCSPLGTTGPGVSGYSLVGHDRYAPSSHNGSYYGGHVAYDGFVRTGPALASVPHLVSPASSRPSSSHSTHRPLHSMTAPSQWATPALLSSPDPIEPYVCCYPNNFAQPVTDASSGFFSLIISRRETWWGNLRTIIDASIPMKPLFLCFAF